MFSRTAISIVLVGLGAAAPWLVQDWLNVKSDEERAGRLYSAVGGFRSKLAGDLIDSKEGIGKSEQSGRGASSAGRPRYPVATSTVRLLQGLIPPSLGGSSTGGFTDCMLQHGAKHVIALDVGTNQLHWKMRQHPRVTVIEQYNARNLKVEDLPYVPQFACFDVSFISLKLVMPPVIEALSPIAELVTLIKPQFEAGREQVEKGGVVRDVAVHQEVIERIKKYGVEEDKIIEYNKIREKKLKRILK
jgi:hypothetical protein